VADEGRRDVPWRTGATAALQPLPEAVAPRADGPLGSWAVESTADLRGLRRALQDALRAPRHVTGPVVLVASELATNALHHGVPPVVVSLGRVEGGYLLDAADGSLDAVPTYSAYRPAGEGGFGLYLVGRLADEVGWYAAGGRKHVWAVLRH
jgi:anti-sigma regulatory factor (Ser/Thr protein kinase)